MSFSPFDHPVLSAYLGDAELAEIFSARSEVAAMLAFEAALAEAEAAEGIIATEAAEIISRICSDFEPNLEELRQGVTRDGVAVPALVRQLRIAVGAEHAGAVHFGATSQDVADTALVLRARSALRLLDERIGTIIAAVEALADAYGGRALMARTRMQIAVPVTVAARLRNWSEPLERLREDAAAVEAAAIRLQFGGAAGTLERLGAAGPAVAERLGLLLDLAVPEASWHVQRDGLVRLAGWLAALTGALGKIGQDVLLMAQNERGEIVLCEAGGSSAMPHKQNPVAAEALVALARFAAVQAGGMHHAALHEQERSGAAWTLEWLILPQLFAAAGGGVARARALVQSIEELGVPAAAD